jgi:hypothetical protein
LRGRVALDLRSVLEEGIRKQWSVSSEQWPVSAITFSCQLITIHPPSEGTELRRDFGDRNLITACCSLTTAYWPLNYVPRTFRIGNFPINTYGVLLATAFLVALLVAARLAGARWIAARKDLRSRVVDAARGNRRLETLLLWVEPEYRANPLHLISLDFLRSGGVFTAA